MTGGGEDHRVFRPGGVSYLHIPAPDPGRSAAFYRAAFAWSIRDDEGSPAFEDGTGHVIGHFIRGLAVAGHARHLPYAYVDSVDETLDKVTANGGTIIRPPFPEGDLWVATVEDPAGNLLGVWQRGPSERGYLLTTIDERRCRDGRARIGARDRALGSGGG
jgi:predicted enzyme related to lactoylglutathione lyase